MKQSARVKEAVGDVQVKISQGEAAHAGSGASDLEQAKTAVRRYSRERRVALDAALDAERKAH
jgi:hypothetical protein